MTTNAQRGQAWADRLAKSIRSAAGKGLVAAKSFAVARIKETLSVPAPRKAVRAPSVGRKKGGILYYRATAPAVPGAPPRKLSSRLRTSIVGQMVYPMTAVIGSNARGNPTRKHPQGFSYSRYHELKTPSMPGSGLHPYILPTIKKWRKQLAGIVGRQIRVGVR